jgi:hypothetical protein
MEFMWRAVYTCIFIAIPKGGDIMWWGDDDNDSRRTLGIRDKQILYRNAKGKCQNPACGRKIEFDEMQVGHKTAWSKGGRTTLKNLVCLCYRCNKLQGTDSWTVFLKKQNIEDPEAKAKTKAKESLEAIKQSLKTLNISQLKLLATKHHLSVKGDTEEGWLGDVHTFAPTKSNYINKLAGVVTAKELSSLSKETSKTKTVTRKITKKKTTR